MPSINELIKINVTRQTAAVPQAGFGTILVLSFETPPAGFTSDFGVYTKENFATSFDSTTEVYKILESHFSQDLNPTKAYVGYKLSTDSDIPSALDRISLKSEGAFYCVCPVGTTDVEELEAVAKWVESVSRICFIQTAKDDALDAYDSSDTDATQASAEIGNILKNGNFSRTAGFYTSDADDWITGAIAGRTLPAIPGSLTFAYKSLKGVNKSILSDTQVNNLDAKNLNYLRELGGRSVTLNGKMADGGFIDLIRDTDWITSRIQESVIFRLNNSDKIPYTEEGANVIESTLRSVLDQAVLNNILEAGYEVVRQPISTIPINERANRKFPEIRVVGRYSGAIQSVEFQLTLSV